jgi:hypothetical protein
MLMPSLLRAPGLVRWRPTATPDTLPLDEAVIASDLLPDQAVTIPFENNKQMQNKHPVHLAYQPAANSTILSEQTSHQQSVNITFLSEQTSTSHQPPAKRTGRKDVTSLPSFEQCTFLLQTRPIPSSNIKHDFPLTRTSTLSFRLFGCLSICVIYLFN